MQPIANIHCANDEARPFSQNTCAPIAGVTEATKPTPSKYKISDGVISVTLMPVLPENPDTTADVFFHAAFLLVHSGRRDVCLFVKQLDLELQV